MSNTQKPAGKANDGKVRLTRIAERTLPKRVRMLLEGLLEQTTFFEPAFEQFFSEVEQRLFKQADAARSNEEQSRLFEALREVKRGKADVVPRFLTHIESSLACIDQPQAAPEADTSARRRGPAQFELVDSRELEITLAMQDISNKAEIRHSGELYLLGNRLGVLGSRQFLEAHDMPLGPMALAHGFQYAISELDLEQGERIRVFQDFDRVVIGPIGQYYEKVNQFLAEHGVLPNLAPQAPRGPNRSDKDKPEAEAAQAAAPETETRAPGDGAAAQGSFAPGGGAAMRAGNGSGPGVGMPARQGGGSAGAGGGSFGSGTASAVPSRGGGAMPSGMGTGVRGAAGMGGAAGPRGGASASASTSGMADAADGGETDPDMFNSLRNLLAERRQSLAIPTPRAPAASYTASRSDLQTVLGRLQRQPVDQIMQDGKPVARGIGHLKQDLLTRLRAESPNGQTPVLTDEDSDTIDLVGMLFDYINQNLSSHSSSRDLITKLQVPVLRSAINDKRFFTQRNHPARMLLNSVAEASSNWMFDDETDTGLVDTMNSMVDRVTHEFNGDLGLMESLLSDFGRYMSQVTRRAEVSERRHVEAAKGRERLDLSRQHAQAAIARLISRGKPAPMVRAVLEQAWADVLALTVLRQGEDSQAYRRCLAVADQLMKLDPASGKVSDTIREEVRNGLLQVGLHGDEVEGVVAKLFDAGQAEKKTSHTELTFALKSKTRLGGESQTGEAPAPAAAPSSLTEAEREMMQRIRTLPFGTWFEFVTNQQGNVVRRKLAWFSTVTGRCLFVNQRGARADEKTIEQVARDLVRGQIRLLQPESESLIDRAWKAIKEKLQQFTGHSNQPAPA